MKKKSFFKNYFFKYKSLTILTFFLNLILWITTISITYITGKYIDLLVSHASWKYIYIFSAILLLIGITHILVGNLNNYFSTKLQANLVFNINSEVLQHVKKLPISFFTTVNSVYLNQRINSDSNTVVNFFISIVVQLTVQLLTFIGILIIFVEKNLFLTILIILSIPIYLIMYFIFEKKLYKSSLNFKEEQNKFFSKMNKHLFNVSYIKLNALFNNLDDDLKSYYPKFLKSLLKYKKWDYYFFSVESILDTIFNVILFLYGGISIYKNKISVGDFIIIKSYYEMLLESISNLTNILNSFPETKVSYNRILEILNSNPESNGNIKINSINSIELTNVNLKLNDNHIIKNFSYTFSKGNIYMIKGHNGSGKSTLSKLILGLYIDNFEGDIKFNNSSIKNLDLYHIRNNLVSIVDQEPILIHSNLYKNLTQNITNVDLNLINTLIKELKISLNQSIDKYNIDNSSNHLSGGEKQKISIIRSLVKNSDLLILDEPTSALDEYATSTLISKINSLKENKIIIIISHDERLDCICNNFISL